MEIDILFSVFIYERTKFNLYGKAQFSFVSINFYEFFRFKRNVFIIKNSLRVARAMNVITVHNVYGQKKVDTMVC